MAKGYAKKYFAKVAALNTLLDKGGDEAKDAVMAKKRLVNSSAAKKKGKRKSSDLLDSRAMLPGSYESGKR